MHAVPINCAQTINRHRQLKLVVITIQTGKGAQEKAIATREFQQDSTQYLQHLQQSNHTIITWGIWLIGAYRLLCSGMNLATLSLEYGLVLLLIFNLL